jgi:hypothetical protein
MAAETVVDLLEVAVRVALQGLVPQRQGKGPEEDVQALLFPRLHLVPAEAPVRHERLVPRLVGALRAQQFPPGLPLLKHIRGPKPSLHNSHHLVKNKPMLRRHLH